VTPEPPPFLRFERALPGDVRETIRARPIAYVPLGALEWHGEHAALGLDAIKAAWICEHAAARTGGVVFPAMTWGAFHTLRFPFTFRFPKRALRRQVRTTLRALADWGFRSIVLLTGHYPLAQVAMVRDECRRVSRRPGVAALGVPDSALALDLGYLGDHAAKWETSILMAIDPALVDLARLPADTGSLRRRAIRHGIYGVCPRREADPELGRKALETIVTRLADAATGMLAEGVAPAEAIYRAHREAFHDPWAAGRTALGVTSKWEILRFVVGNVIRMRHL
jgi:creatinine amidohydrolase